ncbi:MAG: two-component regulator propeller domain-containing protein [Bacteroidota bacterium]
MQKVLTFFGCLFAFFLTAQENAYFINSIGDTLPTGRPFRAVGHRVTGATIQPPQITVAKSPKKVKAYDNKILAGAPTIIEIDTTKVQKIVFGTNNWSTPAVLDLTNEVVPASQPILTPMQPPSFKDIATQDIRYLDVEHGLTSSYHFSVFEDSQGYFWFSSWDIGVGRYDGQSLISFTTKEGLIQNRVLTIFEDSKGHLWFGTAYGLSRYDGQQFVNYQIPDEIFVVFEDSQHRIWVGSGAGGAGYFDEQGDFFHVTTEHGLPSNNVNAILEDQAGAIWLAGEGGITKYEEKGLTIYPVQDNWEINYLSDMCLDKRGGIWISTDNGVGYFDGKTLKKYTEAQGLSHNVVFDVMPDREGNIWFGTRRGGACQFDGTHFTHYQTQEGVSFVEVMSLFEDSRGQIWMVTYGAGINILNPYSFQNFSTSEGLSHNVVNHIMEDSQGNLWMSTEGKGAIKYDGTFYYHYTTQTGMVTDEIAYTFEDSQGNIWLATFERGAIKFDGQTFTHYGEAQGLRAPNIGAIVEDLKGNIWFSSEGDDGLFQFDGQRFTQFSVTEGLLDNHLQDLTIDKEGNLWIAGNVGLTKYDGTHFTHYTEQETSIKGGIKSIMYDGATTIWLGTYANGVVKFDGQQFTFLEDKSVLPPNILMAFATDYQNNTWLGTENGLFFLENSKTDTPKFISFQRSDGIKGKDVRHRALCMDAEQQLWIGTGKSLTKLDLPTFYQERKTTIPKVQLNHILLNEVFYDFSETDSTHARLAANDIAFQKKSPYQNIPIDLEIPYDQNHLMVDFIAIDPVAPHKIEYQYQMDNLNSDWSQPTKEHKIDYRSMPFGQYTFKVKAKNTTA